jgi:tRNA (guanine37-N1)-methyltransferase
MMRFHVLTLFPEMIEEGAHNSILARAMDRDLIGVEAVNIRDYTQNKHGRVDDYIYGGGAGLLMQAQPVYDAWEALSHKISMERGADPADPSGQRPVRTVYLSPQGKVFSQEIAQELSQEEDLILLCGHYEGIDERVLEEIVTDEISIGDYVLTGGELPALVLIDAVSRLVPGVLGNDVSAETDSFQDGLLEYPQYSRPEEWRGKKVPAILLSGDHAKVDAWRREQSLLRTKERRPDLYQKYRNSLEHPEEM